MLQNYVPRKYYTVTSYEVVFDDGVFNGYGFPCDENGKIFDDASDAAKENYKWCLEHPEKFVRFNEILKHKRRTYDEAHGTCRCGNEVELYDQYQGACECDKCGKWYNLFGQELLPPEEWEPEEWEWDDEY